MRVPANLFLDKCGEITLQFTQDSLNFSVTIFGC